VRVQELPHLHGLVDELHHMRLPSVEEPPRLVVALHGEQAQSRRRNEGDDEGRSSQRCVPGDAILGSASTSLGRRTQLLRCGPSTPLPAERPQLRRGGDVRVAGELPGR